MSKLRENIDRILGNSIRCLLPSYWWKRLFGMVVDEVEDVRKVANSKANKSVVDDVDALSKRVDTIINRGNNIFPNMPSNAMSLIQSVEAGTFEPRASGGSAATSYKIYKDLNAFIAVIGSHLYIYDFTTGDFKGVTFLGGIYLQTNNELTKLSNAIHYNLVLGDWILGADCFMLDANTGDTYGVTYGNGSVFSFTYEKNGYEYTDRLNPDGTLENISFNKPKSTPTFLLYYPYTTRNDVYTMHESFIEHNATELPKIKNSINNKEGYILNVVAAGTSATDVMTMQDVEFHYLGYGTENTGRLAVITSHNIPIYRAVQTTRLFLGFKEDGSCEVKNIAVGDTLYLYYSEDYGFNFTDAEKAVNAENIIPIWNSLDKGFTPRPIIIRHKVNNTPSGSGNYVSVPAVFTGVDTTGMNITLVGCFSPNRFIAYQYNRTTGEFVSLKEIVPDEELSDTSINAVQNKVVTAALNNKVDKSYVDEKITDLTNEMIANEEVHAGAYNDLNTRLNELSENVHGETVTKEELQNLQNEVIANEEITASAINDLNTRLAALEAAIANL